MSPSSTVAADRGVYFSSTTGASWTKGLDLAAGQIARPRPRLCRRCQCAIAVSDQQRRCYTIAEGRAAMAIKPSYPGVYVEESTAGVHPIEGVSTSVAAFIGVAQAGPNNQPVPVKSHGD